MNPLNVEFSCKSPATNSQVIERLNELETLIYNPYYRVKMNDVLSYAVSPLTHKLQSIRGITVLDSTGRIVQTANRIESDRSVTINSNISLNNAILIIF